MNSWKWQCEDVDTGEVFDSGYVGDPQTGREKADAAASQRGFSPTASWSSDNYRRYRCAGRSALGTVFISQYD